MVRILVNKSVELTSGETRVLKAIKEVYKDTENEVYVYSQSKLGSKRPDFIIIDNKRGISIIEVKDWGESYINKVTNRNVELKERTVENPISQVKGYKSTLESALYNNDFDIDGDNIERVVWFTNIENKDNKKLELLFRKDIKYCFKGDLEKISLDKIFTGGKVNYTEANLKEIRLALFPELEVIKTTESLEKIEGVEDVSVLDSEQEEFVKRLPMGHYLVTGVPGSGKTVMLISRAVHLIRENPEWKILIVTYNKSLAYKLKEKIDKLDEKFSENESINISLENIEITNFHKIAYRFANSKKPFDMASDEWFDEEMPRLAKVNANEIYDAVLIDEYQDFRNSWIELCLMLAKSHEYKGKVLKNIFLAGDRLQGIYNEKEVSWASMGINMQGRSKLLKTSYRGSTEHMRLAINFLSRNESLKKEVNKFYKDEGEKLEIKAKEIGEIKIEAEYEINNIIRNLKKEGYRNKDILILIRGGKAKNELLSSLDYSIKTHVRYISDVEDNEDKIILTTYQSSKGLEAKVVLLTGIDEWSGKGDRMGRKLIYVGITRASERLYIIKDKVGEYMREIENILR
ncbi:MAG: UvrD-helicase domain-containing protein [Clostridium sp.]|uniref:nuclease-related domain-containing DEAD/DEAH box helicase n=1 Tax=Clostridium sp. TaxID=1506 RepID=UPI003F2E7D12